MKNKNIYNSALFSLISQIIIGVICLFGFFVTLKPQDEILYSLLTMETVVQMVELCFYIWLIHNINKLNYDMTYIRYLDWFITTPTMLVTLVIFMIYIDTDDQIEFGETINNNKKKVS